MNGCTERTHRWFNFALAIYCDKHQHEWENYLQAATYSHNISPISGCEHLDPFFLNFGRHALSLENVSIQLPPNPISQDHYALHLISRLQDAHKEFTSIKNDFRRYQREYYDSKARIINIPEGKTVYIRKDHVSPPGGALNTLVYGDVSPRNLQDPKKHQEKFSVTQKYL